MSIFTKTVTSTFLTIGLAVSAFAQETVTADTVLATVDGKEITLGHVIVLAERLPENYDTVPAADLYNGILDQMIQQSFLGASIDVSEKRLKLSSENEARAFAASTALEKLSASQISEADLEKAYAEYVANSPPEPMFLASHILVETEEEANAVIELINAGADFAETAVAKSTGPSGPSGGNLGWFGRGAMVPEFDQAVTEMEVDAVSSPVKTSFGWHVIKLNDKRDHPSFEDKRAELSESMSQKIVTDEIARLEAAAEITKTELTFDLEVIRDGSLLDK